VNLNVVTQMMEEGLKGFTGQTSAAGAWDHLFRKVNPDGYETGQKIAVKINLNNAGGCSDSDNKIDALPQVLIALITTLKAAGVAEDDIWFYDATKGGRYIPDRLRNPVHSHYPNVVFFGKGNCSGVQEATFSQSDDSLRISFKEPNGRLTDRWLPDLLAQATYLINVPILKKHGIHPVTLGFKNHFGSLNNIIREGNDNLHYYIRPSDELYSPNYSPLVDIYSNPNIKDKTVLILGDGLYGAPGAVAEPRRWSTFGDAAPNSLFFATDPVAVDCVMADFVRKEWTWGMTGVHDYLFCAQEAGLGVCEGTRDNPGGNPWQEPYGNGYSKIEYIRIG